MTTARERELIAWLLGGRTIRDGRGLPRQVYLRDGSREEAEARQALSRVLRTSLPLDTGVRFALADLIDPGRYNEVDRRVRFEYRRKGKPSRAAAEAEIARFIRSQEQDGIKLEAAYAAAKARFGLEKTRLKGIYRVWRVILHRLEHRPGQRTKA